MGKTILEAQNFLHMGGPWRLGFFMNHLKLVNSIPEIASNSEGLTK